MTRRFWRRAGGGIVRAPLGDESLRAGMRMADEAAGYTVADPGERAELVRCHAAPWRPHRPRV